MAAGLSAYALYWVIGIVQPQVYRVTFLMVALSLTFLLYPFARRSRAKVTAVDWMLLGAGVVALAWPIVDFEQFVRRAATPTTLDLVLGVVTIGLVLEATRRTVGWILPVTAMAFLVYGYLGPLLGLVGLDLFAHRGYSIDRLVGTLYMTLEGIFGVPLDVAATYIVLFTIYGAILQHSGAGQFFINWAMAAMGRSGGGSGPGRTITLSGFLLGTVSGSGVATTVTLGAVAWPLLRRSGYPPEVGAAILSAAGIGAIMAPPTLGAAAFLIAEFLKISYLQVILMAIVPAMLYYFSILLMIEADSRRMGARTVEVDLPSLGALTRRSGYHFASLLVIIVLLVNGMTPFRAVFSAMVVAVALSFLRREDALRPSRLLAALESGGRGVLSVAATTATAGIIVGVVTLTGLGLKIAGIIVTLAGGSIFLTVVYAALAVWMLGLAVPVTASYIIAAVMIAPALTLVGVPAIAAHMFIFYYAVLSEVSPPTALSPFAAAAITGGNPFRTMMLTWKYTLPAFLVPFTFTLSPEGLGALLQAPWPDVIRTTLTAMVGIAALAMGLGGWLRVEARAAERVLATGGGLLLFYASAATDIAGAAAFALAVTLHLARSRVATEAS
ncbi:MAG: TRAP transporter fused permease subunit [Vicinamibacterales bacterium]|nr:TRAP transporter fused permease subunit [Vicinamibacterales bacterium]MDP7671016.1 TRAP transporter fused permease subunit [Vicinamibacterales bacterium]